MEGAMIGVGHRWPTPIEDLFLSNTTHPPIVGGWVVLHRIMGGSHPYDPPQPVHTHALDIAQYISPMHVLVLFCLLFLCAAAFIFYRCVILPIDSKEKKSRRRKITHNILVYQ